MTTSVATVMRGAQMDSTSPMFMDTDNVPSPQGGQFGQGPAGSRAEAVPNLLQGLQGEEPDYRGRAL